MAAEMKLWEWRALVLGLPYERKTVIRTGLPAIAEKGCGAAVRSLLGVSTYRRRTTAFSIARASR